MKAVLLVLGFTSLAPRALAQESTLGLQSAYLAGLSLGGMAVLWSLPASDSQWYEKPPLTAPGLYHQWKANIGSGPVWDGDMRFFNSYGHIHSGAAYTVMCLQNGLAPLACTLYANAVSLSWEYGPEAVIEKPSYQDILMTGLVGARVGLEFFRWQRHLAAQGGRLFGSSILGGVASFALDPFGKMTAGLVRLFHGGEVQEIGMPFIRPDGVGYMWVVRI